MRFCQDCPDHEACATGAPCEVVAGRDWAVRVTRPDADRPLVLPTPSGREAAEDLARRLDADPTPSRAEVVWRPSGGWRPL